MPTSPSQSATPTTPPVSTTQSRITYNGQTYLLAAARRNGYTWFEARDECKKLNARLPTDEDRVEMIEQLVKPYLTVLSLDPVRFWTDLCEHIAYNNTVSRCVIGTVGSVFTEIDRSFPTSASLAQAVGCVIGKTCILVC